MQCEDVIEKLKGSRAELDGLGVASLRLFGSFGRNEATADSDVDFVVRFDGPATFDRFMDLKFLLEDRLGCRVDLVTEDAMKPWLRPIVESEAVDVA